MLTNVLELPTRSAQPTDMPDSGRNHWPRPLRRQRARAHRAICRARTATGANNGGMDAARSGDSDEPGAAGPVQPEEAPSASLRWLTSQTVRRWIWLLEHAQDIVAVTVGVVLVLLAAVLLVSGIVDFLDGANGSISAAAPELLDRVLLVLILIEIVHTVVLSLRAHRLVAQPFIVVGLIAVIRRILVILTPGGPPVGAAELALLIGMIAVFVGGLIAVTLVEKGADRDRDPNEPVI
jgi:uncharacterized membrane protein (DUF373 family)